MDAGGETGVLGEEAGVQWPQETGSWVEPEEEVSPGPGSMWGRGVTH